MFGSRRKARAVGLDHDADVSSSGQDQGPAVRRPNRPKNRSRISFGVGGTSMADEGDEEESAVIVPKRGLARRAIEQSAARNVDRPPSAESPSGAADTGARELDVAAKFGKDLVSRYGSAGQNTLIPTDAEIQEKKARRARLAKLAKYKIDPEASENDSDREDRPGSDEDEFLTQRDKITLRDSRIFSKKEVDTRLVRDDEDLMEGFDDFTNESGRVALGEAARSEADTRRRAEMQDLIDAAQEDDEDDEDEEERERRVEYEMAQAENAVGRNHANQEDDEGARTPPIITPIPSFEDAMQKLWDVINKMDDDKQANVARLEEIGKERLDLEKREEDIQRLLEQTSLNYEKIVAESGIEIDKANGSTPALLEGRGLEDVGTIAEDPDDSKMQ